MFDNLFTKKVDTSPLFGFFLGILLANQEWVSHYLSKRVGSEDPIKFSVHDTLLAGLFAAMAFSILFSIFRIMVQFIDLKLRQRWLNNHKEPLTLDENEIRQLIGKIDHMQKSIEELKQQNQTKKDDDNPISFYKGA